jgi:hypothetical protein
LLLLEKTIHIMMNVWNTVNIVLNLITLINSILAVLICLSVLLLIIIFHRQSRSVPLLLAGHTCSTLLISAFMLASMAAASLFGYMGMVLEQHGNTKWCRWRGFFIHGFLCALYDSYKLVIVFVELFFIDVKIYIVFLFIHFLYPLNHFLVL